MFRTVMLVVLMFALGCKGNKSATASQADIVKNALITTWHVLAIENGVKTFTSSKDEVTPRRGYEILTFESDGTFKHTLPGPTDRPETTSGNWKWSAENELTLKTSSTVHVLQVHKLSSTRFELTIKD